MLVLSEHLAHLASCVLSHSNGGDVHNKTNKEFRNRYTKSLIGMSAILVLIVFYKCQQVEGGMGIERRKACFPSIQLMNSPLRLEAKVNPKRDNAQVEVIELLFKVAAKECSSLTGKGG